MKLGGATVEIEVSTKFNWLQKKLWKYLLNIDIEDIEEDEQWKRVQKKTQRYQKKNIKSVKENADMAFFESNEDYYFFKAVEHILSDYKRVLKENEILKEEKLQAWEEWNNLEQGSYETEQKLKQQIKELQKENEQLSTEVNSLKGKLDEINKTNFTIIT